jgi:hypothetical protein
MEDARARHAQELQAEKVRAREEAAGARREMQQQLAQARSKAAAAGGQSEQALRVEQGRARELQVQVGAIWRLAAGGWRFAVSGQRSAVSGQRSAVSVWPSTGAWVHGCRCRAASKRELKSAFIDC